MSCEFDNLTFQPAARVLRTFQVIASFATLSESFYVAELARCAPFFLLFAFCFLHNSVEVGLAPPRRAAEQAGAAEHVFHIGHSTHAPDGVQKRRWVSPTG